MTTIRMRINRKCDLCGDEILCGDETAEFEHGRDYFVFHRSCLDDMTSASLADMIGLNIIISEEE